jgi:hypothetical protein
VYGALVLEKDFVALILLLGFMMLCAVISAVTEFMVRVLQLCSCR